MTGPDPRSDPDVRWRVHKALSDVLRAAQDVVYRRSDADGWYAVPEPVDAGDVTGLMSAGEREVVAPLRAALDAYEAVQAATRWAIDDHQRRVHGDAWKRAS